jgi:TfoX/Sxy family transcriptional regulator of competence genes
MGIYTGEKMFAFLLGDDIGLKLAPEDQVQALDLPGAGPMRTDKDEPMRDYVKMPRNVLDNLDAFTEWVERSASYARRKITNTA